MTFLYLHAQVVDDASDAAVIVSGSTLKDDLVGRAYAENSQPVLNQKGMDHLIQHRNLPSDKACYAYQPTSTVLDAMFYNVYVSDRTLALDVNVKNAMFNCRLQAMITRFQDAFDRRNASCLDLGLYAVVMSCNGL